MKNDHKTKNQLGDVLEESFRSYLEYAPDGVYMSDLEGNFLYGNRKCEEIIGYRREELIGKNFLELNILHENSLNKAAQLLQANMEGKSTGPDEIDLISKEGRLKPVEISTNVVQHIGQRIVLAFVRDITERKRADEALRESESLLHSLIDYMHDAMIILNWDGSILFANRAAAKIIEYERPEELVGHNMLEYLHPDSLQKAAEDLEAVKADKMGFLSEYQLDSVTGRHIWVESIGGKIIFRNTSANLVCIRDITERKRAEEALRESEEKYRSLVENISDVIYELDSQGVVLYISPVIRDILGYDPAEIVGKNFIEFVYKDDWSSLAERFSELCKGIEYPSEYRFINKSGELRWARTKTRPIMEDGLFKGARGTLIDVTDRRQVEEALRESEERFRTIAETITEVFWMADIQIGNIFYISSSYERVWGRSPASLYENPLSFIDAIHEEDRERVIADLEVQKDLQPFDHEYRIVRPNGDIRWIWDRGFPVQDDMGQVTRYVGIAQDITGRKRAEEKLRESEEKYRNILENIEDGYFEVDLAGNFTFFNPSLCHILGYPREEMPGMNNRIFMDAQNAKKVFRAFNEIYVTGIPKKGFEWETIRKDGTKTYIEVSVSLIARPGEKPIGFRGIARDITERKQAEEELKESKALTESVVENVPLMIFLKEATDLRFIIFNRAGEELLGYDRRDLIGKNNLDLFPLEQAAHFMAKDREVLEGEVGMLDIPEEPILTAKKGQRLLHTRKVCIRGSDGATKFLLGISEDITERKQAEENLKETLESLRKAFGTIIQVMVSAVEVRDPYTAGHQVRSADLARAIATEMGFTKERIDGIRMAGSIHDIGKLSIPAEILSKPTKLTELEFSLIKEHSRSGYEMLKDVESPWPLAQIVYQHHERMNGTGYPKNLKGDEILMESRILSVADVVEAMASHRPYRPGLGIDAALNEISKNKGILYDPEVSNACLRLFQEKNYKFID